MELGFLKPRSILTSYLNSGASITYGDMLLRPPEASGSYLFPGGGGEGQISSIDSLRAMALARKNDNSFGDSQRVESFGNQAML